MTTAINSKSLDPTGQQMCWIENRTLLATHALTHLEVNARVLLGLYIAIILILAAEHPPRSPFHHRCVYQPW